MVKFLDLRAQYESIKPEIDQAIHAVIEDTAFIGGKYASRFESEFAQYQDSSNCIGVGNGTDALEIAIESLNLEPGSEILVPANSFIASSEAVTRSGHKVVFCDCNQHNYTISLDSIKEKLTPATKAIIAVHLYGHPCDMDGILAISEEHHLKVIEDCAQAHGAEYKGHRVGSLGDIGAFSFYPGKNLGAFGDAGAILTNDDQLALKCRMIANHGRIGKYDHSFEGRNSRLDGIQAAILSTKLKHLDGWLDARASVARYYIGNLKTIHQITLPKTESWAKHVFHLFVIRVDDRDDLKEYLHSSGISCGVHYPKSLSKLAAYEYLGQQSEDILANRYDSQLLSLPIGEHLEEHELEFIVSKIETYYNG